MPGGPGLYSGFRAVLGGLIALFLGGCGSGTAPPPGGWDLPEPHAGPPVTPEVVCHRGANQRAPENTFAAAELCFEAGGTWVEVDVRTSADGVLYVLHDASLNRTTDGRGRIARTQSHQIDQLDAGSWFHPRFVHERVPRLEDLLRRLSGLGKVYLDVKAARSEDVIEVLRATGMEDACLVGFHQKEEALRFRRLAPDLPLKMNVRNLVELKEARKLGTAVAEVRLRDLSPELVRACREAGMALMIPILARRPRAFRAALRWQADLVNVDHVDAFREVLEGARVE